MPSVHIDNVGEMAIIECAGRFVRTETAFKLRDAVTSQTDFLPYLETLARSLAGDDSRNLCSIAG
jgi:hypothetical protein